ncbi:sporulation-specific protein 15 isoform X2 [Culex quinquefasciatus]|uniref:sporulation-specific protein 15 isoform X2 n=1 Tax=Culex quinquefasciatus TaxID=7176 RepID=UPI0018E3A228|nr:sporulation-specific protein 15 isoform X2 [Culex quinquefasciatus]
MSGYDPGGGDQPSRGSTPDLTSLQENFSQQQAKITALRELVRATESAQGKKTASAQEKVKNIAQRLTQYKTKATKSRLSRASSSEVDLMSTRINEETTEVEVDSSFANISSVAYEEQQHMSLPTARARSETPGSEKVNLLRQQMEQNRLKMAARESQKREVEERVIELKHKLEASQHTLEQSTAEFGRSTGDLSGLLLGPPAVTPVKMGRFEFNKSTSDLTQMVAGGGGLTSSLEVERLRYLEGRVKVLEQELANQPSSDERVKELERKILDLEEALKEKECVIEARTQAVSLMTENLTAKGRNTVDLLEDTKQEMLRMQTNFVQAEASLKQELDRLQVELDERSAKVSNLEEMNNILETARYDLTVENSTLRQSLEDVQDFATKISELNKLNQSLQHRITELEGSRYEFITDAEVEQARREGESDERVRELEERVRELEETGDLAEKVRSLEATIEAQREQLEGQSKVYEELQESLQEKTVELNVLNANFSVLQEKLKTAGPKQLFPKSAEEEAEGETSKLKQQLDEANKGAIKSKLKIKQLQKQVDSFKKTSAVHEEVVRLTEEVQTLTQRLAEVEEEKGNLQLHLVNYDGSLPDSELEKRIKILETTCQNQTQAIQLLEEQKLDMDEDLNATRHELETMRESSKVADQGTTSIQSQMTSIEYEEKFEQCVTDREELRTQIGKLESERTELQQKLERYMCENIELLDRIEKLSSVEKVSSAESIEIVEGLTASEKQEIEGYEAAAAKKKKMAAAAGEVGDEGVDEGGAVDEANRSIAKHADVALDPSADDDEDDLNSSLVKLREESSELSHKIELFTNERREVLEKLEALTVENARNVEELERLRAENRELVASGSGSSQSSPVKKGVEFDRDGFEQALRSVENEVANYSKNKDKNKKLQIAKKLAGDAKNLGRLAGGLLAEVDGTSGLREQIMEMTHAQIGKIEQIELLREEVVRKREEIDELKRHLEAKAEKSSSDDEPELLKVELNSRNDEIRELKKELESLAARKTVEVEEVQSRLKGAGNEIDILKELVQEQKQQLIDTYQEHEHDIAGKLKEIQNYENEAKQMREEIERLSRLVEQNSERFDEAMKQQLEQLQEQQDEISHKQETIDTLNAQIIDLYKTMEENANRVIEKEDELQYLQELLDAKKDEVETLHQQLVEVRKQLESAERRLQEALATPAVDEGRVQELDTKNKEQLEKLKKFAANLKKKNVQCQELEDKLAKAQQELEEAKQASPSDDLREENEQLSQKMHHLNNELHKLLQQKYTLETSGQQSQHDLLTLQEKYQQLEDRVQQGESKLQQVANQLADKLKEFQTVSEDLASKNVKIEKCKAIIKEKNKEIQRLQEHERKTAYLEDEIKMSQSKLEDFHNQTLQLGRLKADKEDLNAALKAESEKVRQLELDLELADEQSRKLRDQIAKLERGISLVEQRRNSLERQKKLLGEALDERTQEYSEHEDELMRRLANLTQHDEAIEHKLKEKEDELLELGETLRDVEHQRDQLQTRLNDLERQSATHEEATRRSAELESDNFGLGQQVAALQAEVKRVQGEAEGRVAEKDSEIDQLEVELTNQLAKIENERKLLQEGLERARDENVDLRDEVVRLQENVNSFEQTRTDLEKEVTWLRMQNESLTQDSNELQELRMQIVQDQTELENLRGQCETLVQNHQCEIQALKQQIADMEAIRTQLSQNQTDDQVQVQNEMRKLKGLLEQKEEEILGLRAGKEQADGDLEELKRQLEALEQSLKRDEALEQQLEKKSSELEAMSKQLFPTMQAEPIAGTSQFFAGQPESTAISLFDSAGDGWGWDEPVVTQQAHQEVSAVPEVDEVGQLRAQIEELQAKLAAITDRDDEFHQLKDELDILRAQNSSLSYEIAEKASKLKHIAATLQAEQLRASELEEQLEKLEGEVVPSVSSFFTDSMAPVFEELVVPKVTYQCKPSVSVEEPMFATAVAGSQHAAPSQDSALDEELAKLKAASEEQCQRIEDQVRQLLQLQELNGSLQQKLEEQNEVVGELRREVEKLLETNQQQKLQEDLQIGQLKQEIENLEQTKQRGDSQISQLRQEVERLLEENTRQQQLKETELEQLRASNQQHQDNQVSSLRQEIEQLSTTNQQFLAEQKSLKEALNSLQQHNELEQTKMDMEREQLQHELGNLKQLNESLQQDRDTFLQLQDELDIVRAQNASLQHELQDKSDRIKRLAGTLTETEVRIGQLEATTAASFFGGVAAQPAAEVFEEIIQPKKAFQLDEEDCWGGEEALLEEQHQRKSSERDDYIRQLELEKERLQQEITELKVKSGKLLKKVKEYKVKSESLELRRSASIETSELDLAIQEELNAQVRGLEGKLKEVQAERESLLKRVDVLTAANDRFAEMKERQDGQIEVQLAKIRELSGKLQQLEDWGDESTEKEVKPAVVEAGQVTSAEVEELRKEVDDLRVDNEELQALLEEEKANVEILEKRVAQKDGEIQELIEKIDGLSQDSRTIKTSLESLNQQKSQETVELSQKLKELMGRNTELTQQIESMRSESLFQNSEQESKLQEQVQQLSAQLQYKEAEIVHLSERIEQQAREDQTQSLVQEILGKNQEISALKARLQQLQSEHQDLQSNLTLQITKELAGSRPEDDKSAKLAELERANRDLLEEKHQMEQELQVLNDQVIASLEFEDRMKGIVLELDAKNIEIEALKASLETLKQSAVSSEQSTPTASKEQAGDESIRKQLQKLQKERADLEANYRITLEQRDAHWQHVVEERGAQVAESWKQHVDLREAEFTVIEKSLREEIERLQGQNPNPPQAAAEPAAIVQMKEALEAQELEIVTLKEQLAIRSAEYARLAAQVDPFAVKHAMNMVTSEPKPVDNGDKVPRSELELALYMIYQRDMRCEELELELRNLLEERDALQLRLSNALRLQEEFKRKFNAPVGASGDSSDLSKTTTPEKSLQQIVQESGIGAATTTTSASSVPEELSSKLSELHSIGHSRDKRQQEDREERHRQLALIQRDLANMPLEAAARITGGSVGAPSESSSPHQQQQVQQQSASSVLINWILGKKSDT